MSMFYGTVKNMKSVTAAEAAALTAHAVLAAGDRVGGLVFSDDEMVELKPRRSHKAVNLLLSRIADFNNALNATRRVSSPMPINRVLAAALRMATHDHLILVFSDFDGVDEGTHRLLSALARNNDLILNLVTDPSAEALGGGRFVASDGHLQIDLDLENRRTLEAVSNYSAGRLEQIRAWQTDLGIAVLPFTTADDTAQQMRRLMGRVA